MGAWGVAIFSDDTASDIRSQFRDLIADGSTPEEATNTLLKEFGTLDEDEEPVFWLSLAATQWKLGRLQEDVKSKALAIIENGMDLAHWEDDPKQKKKRAAVLERLKEQLNSPQPAAKKVTKRFVCQTDLKRGDAIAYRLLSGKYIILKVTGIYEEHSGSRYPVFEICDWIGTTIPSKEQINQFPLKEWRWLNGQTEMRTLALFPAGKRDDPTKRYEIVAEDTQIQLEFKLSMSFMMTWKAFDESLGKFYHYE